MKCVRLDHAVILLTPKFFWNWLQNW